MEGGRSQEIDIWTAGINDLRRDVRSPVNDFDSLISRFGFTVTFSRTNWDLEVGREGPVPKNVKTVRSLFTVFTVFGWCFLNCLLLCILLTKALMYTRGFWKAYMTVA